MMQCLDKKFTFNLSIILSVRNNFKNIVWEKLSVVIVDCSDLLQQKLLYSTSTQFRNYLETVARVLKRRNIESQNIELFPTASPFKLESMTSDPISLYQVSKITKYPFDCPLPKVTGGSQCQCLTGIYLSQMTLSH